MELGISPILTSGLLMQLLSGSRIFDVRLKRYYLFKPSLSVVHLTA